MTQSGEVRTGYYPDSTKVIDSLDPNDSWQYLSQGMVEGAEHFVMLNDTEDKVYIVNATSGVLWGNFTAPPYTYGLDIDGNTILCYNVAGLPKKNRKILTERRSPG